MKSPTVGVIGAGQLGRMLALAGFPLGIRCLFLDSAADAPAAQLSEIVAAGLDDRQALLGMAARVDVLTIDIENVPIDALEAAARVTALYPPPDAIGAAQDRLTEKRLFESLGIPTVAYTAIDRRADLAGAAALGWPLVLKTRRLGYDGRGQRVVHSEAELASAWQALGAVPAIAEARVPFDRELSLIGVFGAGGARACYPLAENVHRDGQLHSSIAPYPSPQLQALAEDWLAAIGERLDYRGVLTVEFFLADGRLIANEMAPRVHNSGHWTIEGAETSQFENHLRAVLGWPLGATDARGHAAMVNLIGRLPSRAALLALPGAHLHDYGKQARPARKLGHCTIVDTDRERLLERLAGLEALVDRGGA
jgi:5-(carboxyamino)imidazole ribonucleotide synthase